MAMTLADYVAAAQAAGLGTSQQAVQQVQQQAASMGTDATTAAQAISVAAQYGGTPEQWTTLKRVAEAGAPSEKKTVLPGSMATGSIPTPEPLQIQAPEPEPPKLTDFPVTPGTMMQFSPQEEKFVPQSYLTAIKQYETQQPLVGGGIALPGGILPAGTQPKVTVQPSPIGFTGLEQATNAQLWEEIRSADSSRPEFQAAVEEMSKRQTQAAQQIAQGVQPDPGVMSSTAAAIQEGVVLTPQQLVGGGEVPKEVREREGMEMAALQSRAEELARVSTPDTFTGESGTTYHKPAGVTYTQWATLIASGNESAIRGTVEGREVKPTPVAPTPPTETFETKEEIVVGEPSEVPAGPALSTRPEVTAAAPGFYDYELAVARGEVGPPTPVPAPKPTVAPSVTSPITVTPAMSAALSVLPGGATMLKGWQLAGIAQPTVPTVRIGGGTTGMLGVPLTLPVATTEEPSVQVSKPVATLGPAQQIVETPAGEFFKGGEMVGITGVGDVYLPEGYKYEGGWVVTPEGAKISPQDASGIIRTIEGLRPAPAPSSPFTGGWGPEGKWITPEGYGERPTSILTAEPTKVYEYPEVAGPGGVSFTGMPTVKYMVGETEAGPPVEEAVLPTLGTAADIRKALEMERKIEAGELTAIPMEIEPIAGLYGVGAKPKEGTLWTGVDLEYKPPEPIKQELVYQVGDEPMRLLIPEGATEGEITAMLPFTPTEVTTPEAYAELMGVSLEDAQAVFDQDRIDALSLAGKEYDDAVAAAFADVSQVLYNPATGGLWQASQLEDTTGWVPATPEQIQDYFNQKKEGLEAGTWFGQTKDEYVQSRMGDYSPEFVINVTPEAYIETTGGGKGSYITGAGEEISVEEARAYEGISPGWLYSAIATGDVSVGGLRNIVSGIQVAEGERKVVADNALTKLASSPYAQFETVNIDGVDALRLTGYDLYAAYDAGVLRNQELAALTDVATMEMMKEMSNWRPEKDETYQAVMEAGGAEGIDPSYLDRLSERWTEIFSWGKGRTREDDFDAMLKSYQQSMLITDAINEKRPEVIEEAYEMGYFGQPGPEAREAADAALGILNAGYKVPYEDFDKFEDNYFKGNGVWDFGKYWVPIYGSILTARERGFKSGYTWLSIGADALMIAPLAGGVARGSVRTGLAGAVAKPGGFAGRVLSIPKIGAPLYSLGVGGKETVLAPLTIGRTITRGITTGHPWQTAKTLIGGGVREAFAVAGEGTPHFIVKSRPYQWLAKPSGIRKLTGAPLRWAGEGAGFTQTYIKTPRALLVGEAVFDPQLAYAVRGGGLAGLGSGAAAAGLTGTAFGGLPDEQLLSRIGGLYTQSLAGAPTTRGQIGKGLTWLGRKVTGRTPTVSYRTVEMPDGTVRVVAPTTDYPEVPGSGYTGAVMDEGGAWPELVETGPRSLGYGGAEGGEVVQPTIAYEGGKPKVYAQGTDYMGRPIDWETGRPINLPESGIDYDIRYGPPPQTASSKPGSTMHYRDVIGRDGKFYTARIDTKTGRVQYQAADGTFFDGDVTGITSIGGEPVDIWAPRVESTQLSFGDVRALPTGSQERYSKALKTMQDIGFPTAETSWDDLRSWFAARDIASEGFYTSTPPLTSIPSGYRPPSGAPEGITFEVDPATGTVVREVRTGPGGVSRQLGFGELIDEEPILLPVDIGESPTGGIIPDVLSEPMPTGYWQLGAEGGPPRWVDTAPFATTPPSEVGSWWVDELGRTHYRPPGSTGPGETWRQWEALQPKVTTPGGVGVSPTPSAGQLWYWKAAPEGWVAPPPIVAAPGQVVQPITGLKWTSRLADIGSRLWGGATSWMPRNLRNLAVAGFASGVMTTASPGFMPGAAVGEIVSPVGATAQLADLGDAGRVLGAAERVSATPVTVAMPDEYFRGPRIVPTVVSGAPTAFAPQFTGVVPATSLVQQISAPTTSFTTMPLAEVAYEPVVAEPGAVVTRPSFEFAAPIMETRPFYTESVAALSAFPVSTEVSIAGYPYVTARPEVTEGVTGIPGEVAPLPTVIAAPVKVPFDVPEVEATPITITGPVEEPIRAPVEVPVQMPIYAPIEAPWKITSPIFEETPTFGRPTYWDDGAPFRPPIIDVSTRIPGVTTPPIIAAGILPFGLGGAVAGGGGGGALGRAPFAPQRGSYWVRPGLEIYFRDPFTGKVITREIAPEYARRYGAVGTAVGQRPRKKKRKKKEERDRSVEFGRDMGQLLSI